LERINYPPTATICATPGEPRPQQILRIALFEHSLTEPADMAKVLVVMNRAFGYIFFAAVVTLAGGCKEPQRISAQVSSEGIKLADLKPAEGMELPAAINFQIFIFETPAEKVPLPKELFLGLIRKPLHFADYNAFEANSFLAGFGRYEMWNEIAARLARAGAKNAGTNRLMVFDDRSDDIIFTTLGAEQSVFYTTGNGKLAGASLGGGQLAWRIKARPNPRLRGASEVEIQPVFRRQVDNTIARLLGREEKDEIIFDFAGFELTMSSGDFVLLGPGQYRQDDITLSSLFFTSHGNFAFPKPRQNEKGEEIPGKPVYTLQKDVPLVRFFLIACTRVQD
jgi:hypothetical protein